MIANCVVNWQSDQIAFMLYIYDDISGISGGVSFSLREGNENE